jgi:hypothetical protein
MEKLTDNEDDDDDDGFWNDMGHQDCRELLCLSLTAALVVETLEGLVKARESPTRKLATNKAKADKADDRNIIMFCSDGRSLRRVNYVLGA